MIGTTNASLRRRRWQRRCPAPARLFSLLVLLLSSSWSSSSEGGGGAFAWVATNDVASKPMMILRQRLDGASSPRRATPPNQPSAHSAVARDSSSVVLRMSQGKGARGQSQTDAFLSFMNEPLPTLVDPNSVVGPPESDDLAPLVRTIVAAADKRKAGDIVALRVSKVTAMTTFLVVCTGNSRPQNDAIAAAVLDDVAEYHEGMRTRGDGGAEGTADSGWILLDYGDVMVHVMTPKSRLFYDVEGQWREKGAEEMDLSDVLLPPDVPSVSVATSAGGSAGFEDLEEDMERDNDDEEEEAPLGGTMDGLSEEEDPFWS